MRLVWAVIWCAASAVAPARAAPVPSWIEAQWARDLPRLAAAAEDGVTALIEARYDPGTPGALDIRAEAEGAVIRIALSGGGWAAPSPKAVELIQQNLAHEYAHVLQHRAEGWENVPRFLHEGAAEAAAFDLLEEAGIWTVGQTLGPARRLRARCEAALRRGPLRARLDTGDRDAVYGCGFVLVEAAQRRAAEPALVLYARTVVALSNPMAFGSWAAAEFDTAFLLSVRAFLSADFTGAAHGYATRGLAAGRL